MIKEGAKVLQWGKESFQQILLEQTPQAKNNDPRLYSHATHKN